jgi:hypothetical protein
VDAQSKDRIRVRISPGPENNSAAAFDGGGWDFIERLRRMRQ